MLDASLTIVTVYLGNMLEYYNHEFVYLGQNS